MALWERVRQISAGMWSWWIERWSSSAELELSMVLIALALALVCVLTPVVWSAARNAVTIVHEMGHVVMAHLAGRRIAGIRVHTDTSGVALTRGRPRGVGMLLTSLAGYPSPGLVGVALLVCVVLGHAGAALMVVVIALLVALVLVRNLWGLITVLASLLGTGAVLWRGDAEIMTALVLGLGLFLALGSVRAASDLAISHWRGEAELSDAVSAAQAIVMVPRAVWLAFFVVVTGVCAALATGLAVVPALMAL